MVDDTLLRSMRGDTIINVLIRRYAYCARKKVAGALAGSKFLDKFRQVKTGSVIGVFSDFYVTLKSR